MPATPPTRFSVESAKVSLYLLNLAHPDGASKARFFIGWGFDTRRPEELAAALLDHPFSTPLVRAEITRWGRRCVFEGPLPAPNGLTPPIRTVWDVKPGDTIARLVTACPF